MKNDVLVTISVNDEYVVQFSDKYELTKNLLLTVPKGYIAIAYVDGKPLFKSNQCVKEIVYKKCGKEYLSKEIQFAFYSPHIFPQILFGFGPINVNNERLKEAYRVGINGQMEITFQDYIKLIHYFSFVDSITVEAVRQRILPVIKTVGIPILSSCFANTKVSVFEIDSMLGEIRERMTEAFVKEKALEKMGIEVESVTINQIHVNEEDLEMVRNRINN